MVKKIDRRHEPRRMRRHEAWILTNAGRRICRVTEISTDGVTLTLKDSVPLPKLFRITFSERAAQSKNCELVWQRDNMAGVKFE